MLRLCTTIYYIFTDRGYTLTFKLADDANLVLSKYGEYLYKNLIVFAPSVLEFGGQIDTEAITKFIDDGGNLLMAGNAAAGDVYREIASECGFEVNICSYIDSEGHKLSSSRLKDVHC